MYGIKEGVGMSPRTGRPPLGDKKKSERIEVRLTKEKAERLQQCAQLLNVSKAKIVERGIDLVYSTICAQMGGQHGEE